MRLAGKVLFGVPCVRVYGKWIPMQTYISQQ